MSKILVTGGAGYIGSTASDLLIKEGYEVVVLDNLEKGHKEAIKDVTLEQADLRYPNEVMEVFTKHKDIEAVMHFAAYAAAGESMEVPEVYYQNNTAGTANLLKIMVDVGVVKFVFSSTCATYGQPTNLPVDETHTLKPESPYGHSKLLVEQMLEWLAQQGRLSSIRLRYFNAAGALLDGSIGEDKHPVTNIIPAAMLAALGGKEFTLFGDDYDTPDGTNVRDYIHVLDLADAHIKALQKLESFVGTDVFNLGVGKGYSNKEVIEMIREIGEVDFDVTVGPHRSGDPAEIYADNSKAKKELGWEPRYGLREIVESAWKWHSTHPHGYES